MSADWPAKHDVDAVLALIKPGTIYELETKAALRDTGAKTFEQLLFSLGAVDRYMGDESGWRDSIDYRARGRAVWRRFQGEIRELLCGSGEAYDRARSAVADYMQVGLAAAAAELTTRLGLPPGAAGLTAVLVLIIAKVGVETLCGVGGDLSKLKGMPGEECHATGVYSNVVAGQRTRVKKGERFPSADAGNWVYVGPAREE